MNCFQRPKLWLKNFREYFNLSADPTGQTAEFIIMGAGGSTGVPAIGNLWGDCDPDNPLNIRSRTSALIKYQDKNIVIDTGPDFKHQANLHNIEHIDGVLYTHDHGDHTNGIDELRVYRNRQKEFINIFGSDETLLSIKSRHEHMFESRSEFYDRVVEPTYLKAKDMRRSFEVVSGLNVTPFEMQHGNMMATGFRIGDLAYCADMSSITEENLEVLKGIKTLVVDSAGYKFPEGKVHANLKYIEYLREKIEPETTILTVLSVLMDYDTLVKEAPEGVIPAFDGFKINIKF